MGIYDREYYRDETRGSGWLSGVAPACKAIILINVAVFLAEAVFPEARINQTFAAYSDQVFRGHVYQLLTAAFLHHDPFHILWNMLFLWIFGWVGIAILSSLVFPVWEWLDPFTTLHDIGAWVLHRFGVHGPAPAAIPRGARIWPAVVGLGFFIWLELVAIPGNQQLALVAGGYTVLTLALMAQFGRDPWRAGGDTFSLWFRTLNRLASVGIAPAEGRGADPDAVAEASA